MARVLLVDDDTAALGLAAKALTADGHAVVTASDGVEALERFRAAPANCDIVVADVQMPGLDGIALVEAVLAERPQTRAVLMSALAGELTRAEQLAVRGVTVLSKPYTLDALKAAVRRTVG